jgi:hypothetical protein
MTRMAWLVAVVSLAACGSHPAPGPDAASAPRETVMGIKALRPGELGEAMLTGGPNDRAVIHLSAASMMFDYNLHGHPGNATLTVHEEFGVTTADYTFVPQSTADWFLLVRNNPGGPTIDVQVRIELYGAMTWSDWL